jgi:ubiquinone/menaquinone biosynthesis C-methylase UbiE
MRNSLKTIIDKVKHLYDQHNEILDYLFQHYWKDTRPSKMEEKESVIDFSGLSDVFSTTAIIPER